MKNLYFLIITMVCGSSAYAIPVIENWSGVISHSDSQTVGFQAGDTISWAALLDDQSEVGHHFGDGPNDVAENGGGDDTVDEVRCIVGSADPTCTNYLHFQFIDDALYNFHNIADALMDIGTPNTPYDPLDINHQLRWRENDGTEHLSFLSDHLFYAATLSPTNTLQQRAIFRYDYLDNTGGQQAAHILVNDLVLTRFPVPVPTPTAISIMALGLLGIGANALRRNPG